MTEQAVYGWLITVDTADGAPSQVYNVAIQEERLAVEAVKRVVRDPQRASIKIKSRLTKQLFDALKMKAGDVMLGARKKRPRAAQSWSGSQTSPTLAYGYWVIPSRHSLSLRFLEKRKKLPKQRGL